MSVGAIEPQFYRLVGIHSRQYGVILLFYSRFLEGLGLSEVTDMQSQMDKDEWVMITPINHILYLKMGILLWFPKQTTKIKHTIEAPV